MAMAAALQTKPPLTSLKQEQGVGKKNQIEGIFQICSAIRGVPILGSFKAALPSGSGGNLLEKPTIERTSPNRESEFDLRKSRKMSPPYRVMLHNDDYNKREYVVKVLMKVIPGMTLDSAISIMQEAHTNGIAVVVICSQEDAEEHCLQLRGNGLLSSIEPASGGC